VGIELLTIDARIVIADDVAAYVAVLMDKVKADRYPSYSMLRRLLALAS
jgi:hypothetical protein